uniref:Transposase n=1 Tax=Acrobeloides nanus TaxID=290746 RepID=A0A914CR42_9BILA
MCAVTAIEHHTNQVLNVSVVQKNEVDNVSGRMELAGVKKCIEAIESHVRIDDVTIDKHPQVCSHLRQAGYEYHFDPWHVLKGIKKQVRAEMKQLQNEDDKNQLKELGKRFVVHVYTAVEKAEDDPSLCKEYVYSLFNHVRGQHEWEPSNFLDLIPINANTKVGQQFKKEAFAKVLKCPHFENSAEFESNHQPIDPSSNAYQKILEIASKTPFLNDLGRLKHGNFTSVVESFHSVVIHYRPKRKYYSPKGFERRTMLAAMSWNENRLAEIRGERTVVQVYEFYSKAKGEKTVKYKKGPVSEKWKRKIVEDAGREPKVLDFPYPWKKMMMGLLMCLLISLTSS